MQASCSFARAALAPRVGTPAARRGATLVVRATSAPFEESPSKAVGDKISPWFATPFDVAAFGPRITVGALLSAPDRLASIQQDLEKLSALVEDPRPVEEKAEEVVLQVEEIMTECLAKGAVVETDVIGETYSMLESVLPAEVMTPLKDIKDQIPTPPSTTTTASVTESTTVEPEATTIPVAPATPETQEASELLALKDSVNAVMGCIDAIRANEDMAAANVLSLNLKEARDALARSLSELSPSVRMSDDISVTSSIAEAENLLGDIDAQFDF